MPARRHPVFDAVRRVRDADATLAAAFAVAALASVPLAQIAASGARASGPLYLATWFLAALALTGYLLVQFVAAVASADDYAAANPDGYAWSFAFFRAAAVRGFSTLAASVWLVLLAVLAPFVGVSTTAAVAAGALACAAFCVVVSQPHAGPTVAE